MCGISGVHYREQIPSNVALVAVKKMNARMHSRGPDAEGIWSGRGIVLGHRRLAILDLDVRSNQPLISHDGRYVIVFNGEIYNFHELRRALEADGIIFRTASDTEVLLEMFVREGASMLPKLRGMFAFSIWDNQTQSMFLARDPYGIKPLYYANTPSGFVFASQVKALQASGLISSETELAGLAGFYLWGSVPEPWTLYQGVLALPAGHCMWVRSGVSDASVSWQDIRVNWQDSPVAIVERDLQDSVRLAVTDSVRAHLVADVPVGVFLSGGIDSAVMAGLMRQLGASTEGITIAFDEFVGSSNDESPVAAAIARHYGISHHLRRVSRSEFEYDIPLILAAMDQPSVDGVNTWFASKAAAERGYKVVLSGIGGDELFCGYPGFQQIPRAAGWGRIVAGISGSKLLQGVLSYCAMRYSNPKLAGLTSFMGSIEGLYFLKRSLFLPHELPGLLGEDRAREGLSRLAGFPPGMSCFNARDGVSAVGMMESTWYLRNQLLRDSDWASMAHSLELRTPLVDAKLLAELGSLVPNFKRGAGKRMLAHSPMQPLPEAIINRPKTGFSLPMAQWLSESTNSQGWANLSMLAHPTTPWARRWAVTVAESFS